MQIDRVLGPLFVWALLVSPFSSKAVTLNEVCPHSSQRAVESTSQNSPGAIHDITFVGLRRISPEALKPKMCSRVGDQYSAALIDHDVRTLARLGWFDTISVQAADVSDVSDPAPNSQHAVHLTFYATELPVLNSVEYTGSRLLSRQQIDKLLLERKLTPKLGEPENRVALHHVGKEIEAALQDLGHPEAHVKLQEEVSPQATAQVKFEISDGPRVPVGQIRFDGRPAVSQKALRGQMRHLKPGTLFAGLRGKDAYTEGAFEEDRNQLLTYYQNHGYPEARIGQPQVTKYEENAQRWFPWPHRTERERLAVDIPVEAGALYKIDAVETSADVKAAAANGKIQKTTQNSYVAQPYSAQGVENLRRAWQEHINSQEISRTKKLIETPFFQNVEALRFPDPETHTVRVKLQLNSAPAYTLRHLEFRGMHRFPDRYFRSRIPLREGEPLDDHALEAGLARLARTGYFKPIKKEDIKIETNDFTRTADVTIHVEELGQQRASLIGGRGQFGSTLGIAYTLFNFFHIEELLFTKLEGGPESLEIALGFAKEGFLGSKGSLAFSVFNTFLRPRLIPSAQGPFFKQQTLGVNADWNYALTRTDTLRTSSGISESTTQYTFAVPPGSGLTIGDLRAKTSSHWVGAGWVHNTGTERIDFANSVSGGWLGGSENVIRSRAEYGRIVRDPIFNHANAWAFRTVFTGAGSYSGSMPFSARYFAGDEFVRGLREGELGPQAVISPTTASGATQYLAEPAGANLIGAVNLEYRVPLGNSVEAAGFFDLGSGWLLPNWLGPARPALISATNGVLHGSLGIELRWTVPGIGVPIRSYYALNLLRLNRWLPMPGGTLLRSSNRLGAFGWGLGSLF
jgi:outer membrane protein assembly complex protein YaeT